MFQCNPGFQAPELHSSYTTKTKSKTHMPCIWLADKIYSLRPFIEVLWLLKTTQILIYSRSATFYTLSYMLAAEENNAIRYW